MTEMLMYDGGPRDEGPCCGDWPNCYCWEEYVPPDEVRRRALRRFDQLALEKEKRMAGYAQGEWERQIYSATKDEVVAGGRVVCIVPVRKVEGVYSSEQRMVPDPKGEEYARLILSAPAMLRAMNPGLLDWVADRLVEVHGEGANVDFVLALRAKAEAERAALTAARGGCEG